MKRKLLAGIALATAVTVPGALALAQSANPSPATGDDQSLSGQPGDWAGYAHVGYHLDPHWRLELQGGYHNAQTDPASGPASPDQRLCLSQPGGQSCDPTQPSLGAYSESANLVFDALPSDHWVDPFVGVGVSRFEPGTIALASPAMRLMQTGPLGGADLGYQAVIGLAFRPHDRLHFDLTYRWAEGAAPGLTGAPTALTGRVQDQTVAITVRYALSTPRAAITPAPFLGGLGLAGLGADGPPPRTVVVETPSAPEALSAEAAAAVGQTALSASEGRASQVVVDGHADTASKADYNRRLAERRAKAMADAMVSLGVPVSAVDVRWGGEGAPPPPAAPTQPALEANASLGANPK